jgi:hypothetical protein
MVLRRVMQRPEKDIWLMSRHVATPVSLCLRALDVIIKAQ